jgi:hypothetical protein
MLCYLSNFCQMFLVESCMTLLGINIDMEFPKDYILLILDGLLYWMFFTEVALQWSLYLAIIICRASST